jgi:hypothetical protein
MPGDLRVSLRLTAEDLMSPQIVEALSKLQILEQQTARINGQQAQAAQGSHAAAAAHAEAAEKAGLLGGALEHASEVGKRFGEEFVSSAAQIGASLIGFELVVQTFDKITEAAREAEVAERQLTARFGASAGEYREFSEQAARGTNFTAIQFERAAATLQPLTRDYRLTNEELQDLIRNTADLAAANGIGLVQAASDVDGSMRGMTRSGRELGLNLKADVIANMDGLSAAEKRAAAEGDNVASAHARLKVITLDSAAAHGQAAEAAGEAGDNFAKLDKATASLYETMAQSSGIGGLIDVFGRAANSAGDLVRITDLLNSKAAQYRFEYPEKSGADFNKALVTGTLDAELAARAAGGQGGGGFAGPGEGFTPIEAQVPNYVQELATKADDAAAKANTTLQEAYRDEGVRLDNVTAALDHRTAAQEAATKAGADYRDETNRAIEAERAYGGVLVGTREQLAGLDADMRGYETHRSQIGGLEKQLIDDRATRRRLGLPELPGETDAIRQLYKADYRTRLAEGPTALAEVLSHLKLGDWDPSKVAAEHADVTIANATVVVQGGAGGGGQQSAISGGGSAARYAGARSNGPAYQSGLGRFGQ